MLLHCWLPVPLPATAEWAFNKLWEITSWATPLNGLTIAVRIKSGPSPKSRRPFMLPPSSNWPRQILSLQGTHTLSGCFVCLFFANVAHESCLISYLRGKNMVYFELMKEKRGIVLPICGNKESKSKSLCTRYCFSLSHDDSRRYQD